MNLTEMEAIREHLVAEVENGNAFEIWQVLNEWGNALKQFRQELEGERKEYQKAVVSEKYRQKVEHSRSRSKDVLRQEGRIAQITRVLGTEKEEINDE